MTCFNPKHFENINNPNEFPTSGQVLRFDESRHIAWANPPHIIDIPTPNGTIYPESVTYHLINGERSHVSFIDLDGIEHSLGDAHSISFSPSGHPYINRRV